MNKGLIGLWLIIAVVVAACGNNAIYDTHHDLPKDGWHYQDTQYFEVDLSEVTEPVDVTAKVRITSNFPKENLYLKLFTMAPSGKTNERIVNIPLADPYGKWLGKGIGDYLAYEHTFIANTLLEKGVYKFGIMQYMRYEVLPEVNDVGISVTKYAN